MPARAFSRNRSANNLNEPDYRPFAVATFQRTPSRGMPSEVDDDMPSNLMASHSNVPGMTPQELLAAHRMSLAEISKRTDPDLHGLTLSRHQVEPEDIQHASFEDSPDEEFREALESFRFGNTGSE